MLGKIQLKIIPKYDACCVIYTVEQRTSNATSPTLCSKLHITPCSCFVNVNWEAKRSIEQEYTRFVQIFIKYVHCYFAYLTGFDVYFPWISLSCWKAIHTIDITQRDKKFAFLEFC